MDEMSLDFACNLAAYLGLKDILVLSQVCNRYRTTFTSKSIWFAVCNRHDINFEVEHITDPFTQYKVCSAGLNVAAHWRFNKWESGSTNKVVDHSGNNQHLTLCNATYRLRKRGCVIAPGEYLKTDDFATNLDVSKNFTVEVLIKPYDIPSYATEYHCPILSKYGSAAGWELRFNGKKLALLICPFPYQGRFEVTCDLNNPTGYVESIWYHLAATLDGASIKLYVNGSLAAYTIYRGEIEAISPYAGCMYIGYCPGHPPRNSFSGVIKEVRVCHTVLQPSQFLGVPM